MTLLVVGHAKPRMALGEGGFCYYFRAIPKEPKTLYDCKTTCTKHFSCLSAPDIDLCVNYASPVMVIVLSSSCHGGEICIAAIEY